MRVGKQFHSLAPPMGRMLWAMETDEAIERSAMIDRLVGSCVAMRFSQYFSSSFWIFEHWKTRRLLLINERQVYNMYIIQVYDVNQEISFDRHSMISINQRFN